MDNPEAEYQAECKQALRLVCSEWSEKRNTTPMPAQWNNGEAGGRCPLSLAQLDDFILEAPFPHLRSVLKALLTSHMFEPSEALHTLVEKILSFENSKVKTVSVDDIQNINFVPAFFLIFSDLPVHIGIWEGDICKLKIGAIVNAANCYMLGCTTPNHPCIDNVIHDRSGTRQACRNLMREQGSLEKTGIAKITPAYCLPSQFVVHTVGPIYPREGDQRSRVLLAKAYESCLEICKGHTRSIAFCCISTGVFGFPQEPAAHIAMKTTLEWLQRDKNYEHFDSIIFNVFKHEDYVFYQKFRKNYFGAPSEETIDEKPKAEEPVIAVGATEDTPKGVDEETKETEVKEPAIQAPHNTEDQPAPQPKDSNDS